LDVVPFQFMVQLKDIISIANQYNLSSVKVKNRLFSRGMKIN